MNWNIAGRFASSGNAIAYGASATVTPGAIQNPSGSGRILRLDKIWIDYVPQVSANTALISLRRTTGLPTGGVILPIFSKDGNSSVATVSEQPVATAPVVRNVGLLLTQAVSAGQYFLNSPGTLILPNEALALVGIVANQTLAVHWEWSELLS